MKDLDAIARFGITPKECADVVRLVDDGTITRDSGKKLLRWLRGQNAVKLSALIEGAQDLGLREEGELLAHVEKRLAEYWDSVE